MISEAVTSTAKPPLLEVRDLCVHFHLRRRMGLRGAGCVRAVDGVSFDIAPGATLGLVGESGCGKTTVARAILRLVDVTDGRIRFDGTDVLAASRAELRKLRRDVQMVFQDASGSLDPRLTVGRSIAEPLKLRGVSMGRQARRDVAGLLERVGLRSSDADRYPHELSGGQRQRVGIARAIALNPRLIIGDEPVSALDVSIQAGILNLLGDLQREMGLTYLFIAHNLAVVRHVSDRVAVMYLGRIVEIADTADLYDDPRHPYTMALLSAVPGHARRHQPDRFTLRGEVPSPVDPPDGCAFHPRCPLATHECRCVTPLLRHHGDGSPAHHVACHHADISGSIPPPDARGSSPLIDALEGVEPDAPSDPPQSPRVEGGG